MWFVVDRVAESAPARASVLRFRCAVPEGAGAHGGLTVYDYDAGRYPICPTIIIEWSQEEGAPAR